MAGHDADRPLEGAGNANDHREDDQYRHQREDRYPDNASDDTADGLRASRISPRFRVDLTANAPSDDDATDSQQSADDAAHSQDGAKDAENQRQVCLRMLLRRCDLRRGAVWAYCTEGRPIWIGLVRGAVITG